MRPFSRIRALLLVTLVMCVPAAPAAAQVQLSIQAGRVTLVANNVTIRQILAEWARVGQTRIVNAERIQGEPVTLQLRDVPEPQALEILLRSVSGYLAAPRPTVVSTASQFDRIVVMPTAAVPPPAPLPQARTITRPGPGVRAPLQDQDQPGDDDAEEPTVTPPTPRRGPVFAVFPQSPAANPPQPAPRDNPVPADAAGVAAPAVGVPYPGAPTLASPSGVAVPGMVVPVPPSAQGDRPATDRD